MFLKLQCITNKEKKEAPQPLVINFSLVQDFYSCKQPKIGKITKIFLSDGDQFWAKETPDQILKLLKGDAK